MFGQLKKYIAKGGRAHLLVKLCNSQRTSALDLLFYRFTVNHKLGKSYGTHFISVIVVRRGLVVKKRLYIFFVRISQVFKNTEETVFVDPKSFQSIGILFSWNTWCFLVECYYSRILIRAWFEDKFQELLLNNICPF